MAEHIYADIFKEYDKDNSGFIDRKELKEVITATYKKAGIEVTEEAVDFQMNKFDQNKDGKITLQEYADVMRQYLPKWFFIHLILIFRLYR